MAGNFDDAIQAYREALRLNQDSTDALNDLAWILATHPNPRLRNGVEAVQMAERAFQLKPQTQYSGTLDAAYAEAGRFEQAIVQVQKTKQLAATDGQAELANAADQRLALYRAGKPFRQKVTSPDQPGGNQ
jgi:tetratricopeptide (TPR) repeat protein